jgi:nitric oxide dioxygenase
VLISGGIGITPVLSMLNTIVAEQPQRQVTFIHAPSNSNTHAFKEHVKQLENDYQNVNSYVCYDSPTEEDKKSNNYDKEGYVDLNFLKSILSTKETHFYFCGSLPFMEAIIKALNEWEVPKEYIHYEVFSPVAILGEE